MTKSNVLEVPPVHDLKIGLWEGAGDDAFVRLIVNFAHTLDLRVTTEEVENGRQVASLTAIRCALTRGSYFSEPLSSEPAGAFVVAST